jgi:two-component system phosphate regulon response regulator PhoB
LELNHLSLVVEISPLTHIYEDLSKPVISDSKGSIMSLTVLVIEDDPANSALWARHLSYNGWDVRTVSSAEEAEALVAAELPNVVILDIELTSETNGWDLLSKWRSSSRTHDLPIFVVSALDEPRRARAAGATGYLMKPCSPGVLMARIGAALAQQSEAV